MLSHGIKDALMFPCVNAVSLAKFVAYVWEAKPQASRCIGWAREEVSGELCRGCVHGGADSSIKAVGFDFVV
jgi:hypothetical protein